MNNHQRGQWDLEWDSVTSVNQRGQWDLKGDSVT